MTNKPTSNHVIVGVDVGNTKSKGSRLLSNGNCIDVCLPTAVAGGIHKNDNFDSSA